MSYRLARGRDLLRERLQTRIAMAAIPLPCIMLSDHFRPAAVSSTLALTTKRVAVTHVGANMSAAVSKRFSNVEQGVHHA
jgi:hypothetical protein